MKKYVNGEYIDISDDELDKIVNNDDIQEPTIEERLLSVEEVILNLL